MPLRRLSPPPDQVNAGLTGAVAFQAEQWSVRRYVRRATECGAGRPCVRTVLLYLLNMGQNGDDGQSTPKQNETELARDARVALLEAVRKAAESGDGKAAAQFAGAYRALKRRQPTAERSEDIHALPENGIILRNYGPHPDTSQTRTGPLSGGQPHKEGTLGYPGWETEEVEEDGEAGEES